MKKVTGTLQVESLVDCARSKALIEGELSRKPSQPEISEILLVSGRNCVSAMDITEGGVTLEGKTFFNVVYSDMTGELYSFESVANFKHRIDVNGAHNGCSGIPTCFSKNIDYKLLPSGSVLVKAYVEICVSVWENGSIETLAEVTESSGTFIRQETLSVPKRTAFKNSLCAIREDIRLPQNMPTVNKVLDAGGYAVIKNINTESMKISCEGDLKVNIVYESTDKNAPLQSYCVSIPFGEMIGVDEVEESDKVFAFGEIADISAASFEGSDDILSIDASVKITVCSYSVSEVNVITDIYSTKCNYKTSCIPVNYRGLSCFNSAKSILRGSVSLPAAAPDVSRVLFCRSSVQITETNPKEGYAEIKGMVYTQMCYASATGSINTVPLSTDFMAEISMDVMDSSTEIISRAYIEYFDIEGSGRDLDCKYALEISIAAFSHGEICLLGSIDESDEPISKSEGITVYFTSQNEEIWDICKKFHVASEDIKRLNPDIPSGVLPGRTKLILF